MKPLFIFLALTLLVAASPAQVPGRRLVDTERHVVTASRQGDMIVFTMEAIADFTDDHDDSKPLGTGWDYAGIRVDVNDNNIVDKGTDIAFGIRQKTSLLCSQYLLNENASTLCGGLHSAGNLKAEFRSTELQLKPHPVFTFEIPIDELGGGKIGLVFYLSDPVDGRFTYPNSRCPLSFDETIRLDLSKI